MPSRKSSNGWSGGVVYAVGALILFVLFRLLKMKKPAIPKPTTGYRPTPLAPSKDVLTFDEIFKWITAQEGPASLKAVPDGKTKDGKQLFSIGIGHQIQPNESRLLTETITEEEALQLFKKDVDTILASMNKVIKVTLNKNQQLALFSLRYNIGVDAFNKSSLLAELNKGNYTGAALKFADWRLSEGKISKGLQLRRERERILFSKPV